MKDVSGVAVGSGGDARGRGQQLIGQAGLLLLYQVAACDGGARAAVDLDEERLCDGERCGGHRRSADANSVHPVLDRAQGGRDRAALRADAPMDVRHEIGLCGKARQPYLDFQIVPDRGHGDLARQLRCAQWKDRTRRGKRFTVCDFSGRGLGLCNRVRGNRGLDVEVLGGRLVPAPWQAHSKNGGCGDGGDDPGQTKTLDHGDKYDPPIVRGTG